MKIFIIVQKGFQYDDQFYREEGLEDVVKAYSSRERAEAELPALNRQAAIDNGFDKAPGGNPVTDYFEVRELEVANSEVEATPVVVSNAADAYQRSRDMMKKAREEKQAAFRLAFELGCRELFRENPDLEDFSFKSYTDYFADGETPRHHVHGDYPDVNGVEAEDIEYRSSTRKDLQPLLKKVRAFINSYDDEDILDAFDDHVEITVTKPGVVRVEEYVDHD